MVLAVVASLGACGSQQAPSGGGHATKNKRTRPSGGSRTLPPTVRHTPRHLEPVRPFSSPATQVPEVPGTHVPAGRKVVALTFDDGPWPYTPKILAALKRAHVRATFFEIGRQVAETPQLSKQLADAGMSVQIHTWDHRNLTWLSDARIDAEVHRTSGAIYRATGRTPTCVRPPDGEFNRRVSRELARKGYVPVNWDVDPRDWSRPGKARIVHRAVASARPGAIILLHDGGGDRSQTVAALPQIIAKLRAKGYSFVTLCQ